MSGRGLRIGIDARPLRWPGIGRYVRELVGELAQIDREDRFFVYCASAEDAAAFRARAPHLQVRVVPSGLYTIGEQLRLPLSIRRDRLDVFHAPSSLVVPLACSCRLVVTVHDLLLKLHPEHLPSRLAGVYFAIMNAAALRSAARLLAVSEATRAQLCAAYPRYAGKARTVHNGVGAAFRPVRDERRLAALRRSFGLPARYFLYVGTYKKHKNLRLLIEGFGALRAGLRAGCALVLLARRDPRFAEADELLARLGLAREVVRLEGVSEEDLVALYSGAHAVVLPSMHEGFGLPALEAMACGAAVVATRIPAFEEVAGEAALLVEPSDPRAMAEALRRLLEEPGLRERLADAGLRRSARFTWRQAATETLAAYREAACA